MDETRAKLDWFKAVILPHQPALRARLRRRVAQRAELDDLVAEVFARAYANLGWRGVAHGRAYLFGVARNLLIDQARRGGIVSFEALAEFDQLGDGHDLDRQLCARDELRRLQAVVAALPPRCRRVFVARRIEEKSTGAIAEELGLSVSTVEKHLAKAIRHIAAALGERERAVEASDWRPAGDDRATRGALRRDARVEA